MRRVSSRFVCCLALPTVFCTQTRLSNQTCRDRPLLLFKRTLPSDRSYANVYPRGMATRHRSALASRSLAEVYGFAASAALVDHPMGSGFSQQLSSTSLQSPLTPPGWRESPRLRHATNKQAQATPSVLAATHEVKAALAQEHQDWLCWMY